MCVDPTNCGGYCPECQHDTIKRLRETVESAFREGWQDGHAARDAAAAWEPTWGEDAAWNESRARAALEGK